MSLTWSGSGAFVAGYRSVVNVPVEALDDAVHRLWWKRLTDFWQLLFHYEHGDTGFDDLFLDDEALLHWWTEHIDAVHEAMRG
ncbi:hypothetical protein [Streptomyces sp. KL116D]|uniref:hypothetical protein n=1 Tax=Streptomyces sp. KL116D TaxID=3045152 RepID=UPI003556E198